MLRSALWGSAFGSVLLLTSLAQAQCTKDTDCKGERVCEAGMCQVPAAEVAPEPSPAAEAAPAPPPAAAEPEPPPATAAPRAPRRSVDRSEEPPPQPKPKMERHSTGMMAAGIVMVSISPIPLFAGMIYSLGGTVCRGSDRAIDGDDDADCSHYRTAALVYTFTSLALVGAGVPLIVIGAKRVPAKPAWQTAILPYATPEGAGVSLRLEL